MTEAWYGEYFARQKRLKPPAHYIGDEKPKKIIGAGERMDAAPWLALMGEKFEAQSSIMPVTSPSALSR